MNPHAGVPCAATTLIGICDVAVIGGNGTVIDFSGGIASTAQ